MNFIIETLLCLFSPFNCLQKLKSIGIFFHFQKPGSLTFDRLIDFHDFILIYLIFILILFIWVLVWSVNIYNCSLYITKLCFVMLILEYIFVVISAINKDLLRFKYKLLICQFLKYFNNLYFDKIEVQKFFNLVARRKVHAPLLEIFWTVMPSFILLAIAVPSLYLLYMLDAVDPLSYAVKVIGHQWYWSYEIGSSAPLFKTISNMQCCAFDSYMLPDEESNIRLLEVDNVLFVPAGIPVTFFITSTDVIHSWAVPSLGIKVDAIPGRLNQVCVTVFDINMYYGQCSELCGVNHGFMPINVCSVVDKLKLN